MADSINSKRRTALKSVGAVASTLALGVSPVSGGAISTKQRVSLPKLMSGDEVVERHTVPKKWDAHRRVAKQVLDNEDLFINDGVRSKGLSRSSKTYGGKNGLQITMRVDSDSPNDMFPDEIDKIPINVEEVASERFAACSSNSQRCSNYDADTYVEGGEFISNGTAACRGYHQYWDEDRLLTVAHLFTGSYDGCPSESDINGTKVYNYCGGQEDCEWIGEVESCSIEDDWAIIEPYSDTTISDNIDYKNDKIKVAGYVTESGLQDWASRWKWNRPCLYSMGTTTGKTHGKIKHANFALGKSTEKWADDSWFGSGRLDCISYGEDGSSDGVYTYCDIAGGDSGGPTWYEFGTNYGDAWITNLNTSGHYPGSSITCNGSSRLRGQDSSGIAAYEVVEDDYYFNISSSDNRLGG